VAVSYADLQDDVDASSPYSLMTTGFEPIEAAPAPSSTAATTVDTPYTRALRSKKKRQKKKKMHASPARNESVAEHEQYLIEKGYLELESETETESKASNLHQDFTS